MMRMTYSWLCIVKDVSMSTEEAFDRTDDISIKFHQHSTSWNESYDIWRWPRMVVNICNDSRVSLCSLHSCRHEIAIRAKHKYHRAHHGFWIDIIQNSDVSSFTASTQGKCNHKNAAFTLERQSMRQSIDRILKFILTFSTGANLTECTPTERNIVSIQSVYVM